MKWMILLSGILALLVVAIIVVGALLPRHHEVSRAALIHQPAEVVFAVMRNFAALPDWRTGVTAVEVLATGQAGYRETTRHGAITYLVEEEHAARKLVLRIADKDLPFGGKWLFELTPKAGGVEIRITEQGEVKNPVFRFVSRFVLGYTSAMETYLGDLGRKFGESVTPTP